MTATFNLMNGSSIELEGAGDNDIPPWLLLTVAVSATLATCAGGRLLNRRASRSVAELSVTLGKKTLTVSAICDSGNFLTDCVSGRPVVVLDESYTGDFFKGFKKIELGDLAFLDGDTAARVSLIPYFTASGEKTMVAFRPQKLTVKAGARQSEVDALVGFARIKRSVSDCRAIIPPELL